MRDRNPIKTKKRRQELRRLSTKEEAIFWDSVRAKKLGFKVRRQYGIGPYILDFYVPDAGVAIEIDGGIHQNKEVIEKDRNKDAYLEENGITVLRFTNEMIQSELEGVLTTIKEIVNKRTPSVFPFKSGRTPWMANNHEESPPPDAGGDSGGPV